MPIQDRDDAHEVEARIKAIFAASSPDQRARELRRLFVEVLDFDLASGQVPLRAAPAGVTLPGAAERIASLDGVNVCYVALDITDTGRVRRAEAATAAKLIADQLGEDLLLLFTNTSCSQMHFIHPTFEHAQPTLRRMVVERDLPRRTAVQQVAKIYWKCQKFGSIRAALETAFDVEPVTKRFFQEYKRIFNAAETQVSGFGPAEDEDKRLFVQTLFNRLMFVYFLSRKGWLTFGGDKDYLKALWDDYQSKPEQTSFYNDRLYHLFFFGLNNPQSSDLNFNGGYMASVFGDVPFLNGGLFEQTDLDERTDLDVPDGAVEPVLRELFDKFNFTVMESTPFDIEVAVDPEMLGKVFEELVTGRHESGAYYTPRPVVSFMCREALKGYLEGRATAVSAEAIDQFVGQRDASRISLGDAPAMSRALDEITVVDPACGSGAYLLGMLQELVELQTALFNVGVDARSLYELKLHIIERNLYGVDIDEFAVNIAMLRMWLSLAIEYEGEGPEPLPNLDFKIVCGDSLLGPDPSPAVQGDLSAEQIKASNLGHLKAAYMRATAGKDALKREIVAAEEQLRIDLGMEAVPTGVVDWRIEFAEVFVERAGFDVAIANPPYVRMEQLNKNDEAQYKQRFPEVAASRADLLVYFYARAVQVLANRGALAFITSNKYMRAGYGKNLRQFLSASMRINQVIDFGDLPLFTATSYPAVLVGRKGAASTGHQLRIADLTRPVRRELTDRGLRVTPETMNRTMEGLPRLLNCHGHANYSQEFLRPSGWVLEDPALIRLFERLMNQGTPLGEFVDGRIYMGVKTGLNEAFVIDQARRDMLVAADPKSAEIIKPWLRGRDIKRWAPDWAERYVIFTNRGVDIDRYPAIRDHLDWYRPQLEQRATSNLHPWYELQQPQEGIFAEFDRPKIIWPDIAREVRFAFDPNGSYLGNTAYAMPTDSKWLLTFMNSDLAEFLLCQITSSLRGGFLRLIYQYITQLPIVPPAPAIQQRLESIASDGVADIPPDAEELNAMVYDLYGLSASDVALINDWFERRSLSS